MCQKFQVSALSRYVSLALVALAAPLSQPVWAADPGTPATTTELPEVQVKGKLETKEGTAESGYRNTTATAGLFGSMPIQDTPYSINVTSGEQIENRDAHTVSDALKTNPAVATLMDTGAYPSMSRVMIRGFAAADQNDQRDGLGDRSFTYVPLENVERIEVLNGLSSFFNGFADLGGVLNYVSKQPTATPFTSVATGQYGGGIDYLHVDTSGSIDEGKRWSYRINMYGEDGGSYINDNKQKRDLLSGVVNFQLSGNTLIHADISHQDLEMDGLQSYINVNPANGIMVPDASNFSAKTQYGQDWTFNKSEKDLIGFGLESSLNDTFNLRAAYRHGEMWRAYQYVGDTLTNNSGGYSETATGTPQQYEQTNSAYALVDSDFHTGSIGNKLTFGYTGTSFLYTRGDDVSKALGSSNIYNTASFQNPNLLIGPTNVWYQQAFNSWVVGDKMQLNDKWSSVVGFNDTELVQTRWGSGSTLATPNYTQSKITPSYALLFKPVSALTTYVSYVEGLQTGGIAPATAANANQMLLPSVSYQYEFGAKASLGRVDMTAALFDIDVVNQYLDPADNVYKQAGREVHKGFEIAATGKLTDQLTVVAGGTILDAQITQDPKYSGKIPVNVPEQQARLYFEYALTKIPGLTLSGSQNYSGKRAVDSNNLSFMEASTTYDAGVRYETKSGGHKLNFNLNVSNIFDKAYWSYYSSGNGLLQGSPRVISVTAKIGL